VVTDVPHQHKLQTLGDYLSAPVEQETDRMENTALSEVACTTLTANRYTIDNRNRKF